MVIIAMHSKKIVVLNDHIKRLLERERVTPDLGERIFMFHEVNWSVR